MWHPGSPGSLSSVHRLCVTSQRTSLFSLQCQRLFRWLAQLKFAKLRENLRKKMITVSTKRLYSLGKIEASPKGLAITSNLSSGKEVGVTGGGGERRIFVEETGHLRDDPPPFKSFMSFFISLYRRWDFSWSLPSPPSFSVTTKSQCYYLFPNPPTGRL